MNETATIYAEDAWGVRSRVSWGAIFAGVFVAFAVWVFLTVLGLALGLSMAQSARGDTLAAGAGIWTMVTMLVALFCGGCVTTRCSAGESKTEAVIYGVILWGVVFLLTMWVSAVALRSGWGNVMSSPSDTSAAASTIDWDQLAREANLSQEQIDQVRAMLPGVVERDISPLAAWWWLAGIAVSLLAAVAGTLSGAGPNVIGRFTGRQTTVPAGGRSIAAPMP
jgi:hypothetical protein